MPAFMVENKRASMLARNFTGYRRPLARKSRSDLMCPARETPKSRLSTHRLSQFDGLEGPFPASSRAHSQVIVRNEGEGAAAAATTARRRRTAATGLELGGRTAHAALPGSAVPRAPTTRRCRSCTTRRGACGCALLLPSTATGDLGQRVNAGQPPPLGESGLWIAIGVLAAMVPRCGRCCRSCCCERRGGAPRAAERRARRAARRQLRGLGRERTAVAARARAL